METIKIIDLLNKIANGEEVPKKIKFENTEFIYYKKTKQYYIEGFDNNTAYSLRYYLSNFESLNEEVEIIEEKKLPEKIGLIKYCEDQATSLIHHKVDEIIDYLDYLESKEKGE